MDQTNMNMGHANMNMDHANMNMDQTNMDNTPHAHWEEGSAESTTKMGTHHRQHETKSSALLSHSLPANDPANPLNWPAHRRLYATACGWLFGFGVAFGLTSLSTGFNMIATEFNVSTTIAILAFTIYLFAIALAPIYSPHVAERFGRSVFYFISFFIHMLFLLGASRSKSIGSLLVCRFLAGLFGGPSLVLIEGTFADIWSAETTNTYYAFLGTSSYIGAALGPLICGFVVAAKGWRWSQYVALMIDLVILLFSIGFPETYQREIPRRIAKRAGRELRQPLAESGVTIGQMLRTTVVNPAKMLVSEPLVMLATLHLMYNWAVLFQWFVTVPTVLTGVYSWTLQKDGLAFLSAIIASVLAAATSIGIEQFLYSRHKKSVSNDMMSIELRLIPAMIGGILMPTSLFWIGWTAKTTVSQYSPIIGTGLYVYGSLLCVISIVPYLFDAYPPAGTLSALTIAATMRILLGAAIPLTILQMFGNLTGAWALSTFGFIGYAFMPIPFVLFFFGEKMRDRSSFTRMKSIHMPNMDTMDGVQRMGA